MRTCPSCGETKPVDEFWRDRRAKSGYAVYCKTCGRQRNAAKYRARAASEGRGTKPWRPLREDLPAGQLRCQRCYCLTCNAANSYESRNRRHGSASSYHLKQRYGITADDREEMQAAQGRVSSRMTPRSRNERCDICAAKSFRLTCRGLMNDLGDRRRRASRLDETTAPGWSNKGSAA